MDWDLVLARGRLKNVRGHTVFQPAVVCEELQTHKCTSGQFGWLMGTDSTCATQIHSSAMKSWFVTADTEVSKALDCCTPWH